MQLKTEFAKNKCLSTIWSTEAIKIAWGLPCCTMEDVLKPPVAWYSPFLGGDFGAILTFCYLE